MQGDADAGLINNDEDFPEITAAALLSANGANDNEAAVVGWHAIEFLLLSQDLNPNVAVNQVITLVAIVRRVISHQ